jgi:hypothetical protein
MGYTTRPGRYGGEITDFWPDDGPDHFWLMSDSQNSIAAIIEMAKERWGQDINLNDILIESQRIHTECIYYDLHDPGDWTDFIMIGRAA